ncbi:hypothetical protein [Nocardioides sp.]|uniref:hypothetical protein n=1 Tax=Nocardioides sp. TaxID=35761 RepID=UPI002CD42FCC|nr:hypothetical protein [Nocardioides sp.]HSX67820.1 hypothetical protein [Nocardioides sp.]
MRILSTSVALAVFSAAMWFAWLGWDHEYYLVDGYPQGPYRAWQVIGAGATVVAGAVVAYAVVRRAWAIVPLAAAGALGFAIPWSIDAAQTDDSGLWVVGLILLLGGAGAGLLVVLAIATAVFRPRAVARPGA